MSPWRTATAAAAAAVIAGAISIPYTSGSYFDVESMGSDVQAGEWCVDSHGRVIEGGQHRAGPGHDCDEEHDSPLPGQNTIDQPETEGEAADATDSSSVGDSEVGGQQDPTEPDTGFVVPSEDPDAEPSDEPAKDPGGDSSGGSSGDPAHDPGADADPGTVSESAEPVVPEPVPGDVP
jgi:hypothetical protein